MELSVLRELFRNLQAFEALHETEGIDTIRDPSGQDWCLWDVQYLYQSRSHLSPRQQQAIELCLYANIKEREAAKMIGVGESTPVAIYANNGLRRLIAMIDEGRLPKFRSTLREAV